MNSQQHLRTQCLDCAAPMFVLADADACTRYVPCLRKYDQQIYLLQEFLQRAR